MVHELVSGRQNVVYPHHGILVSDKGMKWWYTKYFKSIMLSEKEPDPKDCLVYDFAWANFMGKGNLLTENIAGCMMRKF